MRNDLGSVIISAIVGIVATFLICNMFVASLFPIKDKSYKIIDNDIKSSVADPDENIFNFRAINPTVEVCVGECKETNTYEEYYYELETEIEETEEE